MSGGRFIIRSRAVYTGRAGRPAPAAIAVEGKRILGMLPWDCEKQYEDWEIHDYGDRMVMPSFIDAHTHLFSGAVSASEYVCTDLGRGKSQEECVEIIRAFAREHPDYPRIRGTGWFVGNWKEDRLPDRRLLDQAIPDRPVYLQCADAHSMWMNSRALEEAHIDPNRKLSDGMIVKFDDGQMSGLLLEPSACAPALEKYMEFSDEEMLRIHREFQKHLAALGISAASEMFADDYTEKTYHDYGLLKRLDQEEGLSAHIYAYTRLFGYTDFAPYFRMKEFFDSPHFHIGGLKGFVDGVTETFTGMMLKPYTDRPDCRGLSVPLWPREKIEEEIIAANGAGIQVRLHCIADGSVRLALDAYEKSRAVNGPMNFYNTIEHIENIHPDDIPRFGQIGVLPSMQPYHLTLSRNDKIFRIGEARCRYEWPERSMRESAGMLALGTDFPVVDINPFASLHSAVTRKDEYGVATGHNPWETLTLPEALCGYTQDAARAYRAEKEMGTLEAGKLANLLVLDQNLFEVDAEKIPKTQVLVNYFEGKKIFERSEGYGSEKDVH